MYFKSVFRFVFTAVLAFQVVMGGRTASAELIDGFDNGDPLASETINPYWITFNFSGSANSTIESGGSVRLTVGDDDGVNDSNFAGTLLLSQLDSRFNFFNSPILIEARGIDIFDGGDATDPTTRAMRLGINTNQSTSFSAPDAVYVQVNDAGGVILRHKTNAPSSGGTTVVSQNGLGDITGFDLFLNNVVGQTAYSLSTYTGATKTGTFAGSFAMSLADWDIANGDGYFLVSAREANISGGNQFFTGSLDSLSVTAVPEPASWLMAITMLGAVFFFHHRRTETKRG